MKKITLIFALSLVLSLVLLSAYSRQSDDTAPRSIGLSDAPILVEAFSDLQCPGCAATIPKLEQLIRDNPGLARLDFYHFPLSQHQYAFIASEASECAADQDKFWEYLNKIFETQSSLSEDHLYKLADTVGLDRTAFDACLANRDYKSKIESNLTEGIRRKISSTPAIFVNGQAVNWNNAEQFENYLKSL